jgi:hypothetical protein
MKRAMVVSVLLMLFCGCASKVQKAGFLSDYSKLQAQSDTSMRYLNEEKAKNYKSFIIDPVQVYFHSKSEAAKKIKKEKVQELTQYMHDAVVKSLGDAYAIESVPGPGVCRVHIAITDLKKAEPALNLLPVTKMTGAGLGGASLEIEFLDSQTGEQIAALVESQIGSRLSLAGYSEWGDAKEIMNGWAKRFRARLDEIHQ